MRTHHTVDYPSALSDDSDYEPESQPRATELCRIGNIFGSVRGRDCSFGLTIGHKLIPGRRARFEKTGEFLIRFYHSATEMSMRFKAHSRFCKLSCAAMSRERITVELNDWSNSQTFDLTNPRVPVNPGLL